jgi:O-acetyl-ADP-ribose deacetylase (regulator of RNase III)
MIHFTKGDMFDLDVDIRINTVNCMGVMGAGVALAFKNRYPDMFREYREACSAGEIRPGKLHIWRSPTGDLVVNFPTKRHWREKSRYDDIQAGLNALRDYLQNYKGIKVALPALGCGNGGLDWARVAPMITEQLRELDAEIFVFEPADSLKLGKKVGRQSPEEVMQELETLGFQPFALPVEFAKHANLRVQVKGNAELLVNRWIALLTSLDVGEREFAALVSIATQMGLVPNPPTVALIYRSNASEEIAEVFLKNGLAVVLLLPFGPLVKKRIRLSNDQKNRITYAILSVAESDERKSAQLERFAGDVLRQGASAILLSDPDPRPYSKGFTKLGSRPLFFVRYSTHPNEVVHQLEQSGFRSIGRRADTGEPNLVPMIGDQSTASVSTIALSTSSSQLSAFVTPEQLRNLAELIEQFRPAQDGLYVSLVFDLIPDEMRVAVRRVLCGDSQGRESAHQLADQ